MTDTLLPVVLTPRPFADPVYLEQPANRTIRAMLVDAVAGGHLDINDLSRAELYVDGERIARDVALNHILTEGQIVSVEVAAHGGGGGGRKDVGQILLQIAVIAVSTWVGGGAGGLFGSGTLFARVAAAAVLVAGNMAINALYAPDFKTEKANDRYALQSASNDYRQWGAQPLALGEVVVAPDLAAKTFTQSQGDDVWIYGILGLHRGPCVTADHKIGDTLVSSLGEDEFRMVEHLTPGPRTFSLYPNDVDQADFQEELEATTSTATPVVHAASSEGEQFEFDFYLPGGLNFTKDDGRVLAASVSVTIRYRSVDADGNPTSSWTSGLTVALTSSTKDPWRVMRSINLPLGRYEFEFTRSILEDDNAKRHTDIALTAIRAIAFRKPISDEVLSIIEFAVKATALNQGTLAAITCRITPLCPTWTGSAWGPAVATSNPAALARWFLTGPAPAKPLTPDQADTGLRAWSALCDEYDWSAHLYITDDKRQSDVLALLEQAGRASVFWDGSQIVASTWVEKPTPRQLFAGPNLKDHRWTIDYPDPVHALRVEFENLDQDGEADELFVYNDGYGEVAGPGVAAATLIEALRLDGQKKQDRAYRDGRWSLGQRIHQRRIDTWSADVEHVVCRYGDRVRLAWQRVGGEGGARVRCRRWSGGLVTGLRLDRPVTFEPGEDHVVDIRLNDQLVTGVPVVNPAGAEAVTTREIVFVSPRDAGVSPARADLIAFGIAELVSEDVEIIGIEPGEGLTANLTGVRYVAPLLMEGETGDIPEIQTRLTRDRARTPPAPVLLGVTFEDTGIRVGFSMPPWRGAPITGFTARWRTKPGAGETVGWVDLPDLPAGAMILTTPAPRELPAETDNVTRVEIELRALTASGQASQALLLTAVQPVVAAPASGDWTVTLRTTAADGSLSPALIVTGATSVSRTQTVVIEYSTSGSGPWTPDYSGPATLPEYEITGLVSGVEYWVAVTNLSPQGVPSGRRVYGPYLIPVLVAGDVSATSPTISDINGQITAVFGDIFDLDTELTAAQADIDAYGVEIAAARGGEASLNARIVAVNQARIDGDAASATAITALTARTSAAEADIIDVDNAIAAETSARASDISTVNASIGTLNSTVSTQALAIVDLENNAAIAAWQVKAVATGGKPAIIQAVSSTLGSYVAFGAEQIFFGENSVFDDATDTLTTVVGSMAYVQGWGAPFGAASDLIQWQGDASVAMSARTQANADFFISTAAPGIGGKKLRTSRSRDDILSSYSLSSVGDYDVMPLTYDYAVDGASWVISLDATHTGSGGYSAPIEIISTALDGSDPVVLFNGVAVSAGGPQGRLIDLRSVPSTRNGGRIVFARFSMSSGPITLLTAKLSVFHIG
jgi:hypothetical protein